MTKEELLLRRLQGQHLLEPTDTQRAVKDLCGVQAQFPGYGLHNLSIRSREFLTDGLVKSWTIRGTMHIFSDMDFPLFFHSGRKSSPRPVDTMAGDSWVTEKRKAYFADLIVDSVSQGISQREQLKDVCAKAGMTEEEGRSLFDPWGGVIRALCEDGRICHMVSEKKAYQLCPGFAPMEETAARLELARRYFTSFGPATVKDAAYFFGTTQKMVKSWLPDLNVGETKFANRVFFHIGSGNVSGNLPRCVFLGGFDQLMLGYEKTESLFFSKEYMRDIFNLAGIVRPVVLVNGSVAAWWNKKGRRLTVTQLSMCDQVLIDQAARELWPDIQIVEFRAAR